MRRVAGTALGSQPRVVVGAGVVVALLLLLGVVDSISGGSDSPLAGPGQRAASSGKSLGDWPGPAWRPYGPGAPWNRPLPSSPRIAADSTQIVSRIVGWGGENGAAQPLRAGVHDSADDYYRPVFYSRPDDPLLKVKAHEEHSEVQGIALRIPRVAVPNGGSDHHMTVIDTRGGKEYDFFGVQSRDSGARVLEVTSGGITDWNHTTANGLGSNATAAHFALQAGVVRAQDWQAGKLDHALEISVRCTSGSNVYPAQGGGGAACQDAGDAPPMGTRLALDMSTAEIDALDIPAYRKTVLKAIARYGMFVGDTIGESSAYAWKFNTESALTYTQYGVQDPLVLFARSQHVGASENADYAFDLNRGVDWSRLRVVDPCVTARTC